MTAGKCLSCQQLTGLGQSASSGSHKPITVHTTFLTLDSVALTCRPWEHQAQQQLCEAQWQSQDLAAHPGEVKLEPSEEVKRQGRLRRPSHRSKDDQGLTRAGRGKSSKGRVPVIKQEVHCVLLSCAHGYVCLGDNQRVHCFI